MINQFSDDIDNRRNDPIKVADNRTNNCAKKRSKKRKLNLKSLLCYAICFTIGFFADDPVEFLLLFGLFEAFVFLPD